MKKLGMFFLIFNFYFLYAMESGRENGLKRKQMSSQGLKFDQSEDEVLTGDNQSQGFKDQQVAAALQGNIKKIKK
ncbi:MAG: hypothetical protein WDZ41_05795 [Candidatus Babeliales bacterium]